MRQVTTLLLWFSAISTGLMAGIYFAFSVFIMSAFSRLAPGLGAAAMNAINTGIVRSAFMPLFLATVAASAGLAALAVLRLNEPGAIATLTGGVIYLLGMFVVTMAVNVPLNNGLAADPDTWSGYAVAWTRANHVRTLASLVAAIAFTWALVARKS